jgi:RHS repeat-associated protein
MNPIKILLKLIVLLALYALQSYAQAEIKVTYYIPDASGSPVAATDEQGNVKWLKHYYPFGAEILNEPDQTNSRNNNIGYTGHVNDRSTGLTYMRARYYDPVVGRFMGMDPAPVNPNDPRTFNRFAYANNNPYKYVDPDGRTPLNNRQFSRFSNPNQLVDAGFGAPGLRNSDGLAFRESGGWIKVPNLSAAGSKGVGGTVKPPNVKVGKNRAGEPQIKIQQTDGSIKIISNKRVKIDIPEPRAKKGYKPEKFENSIPGSKGKKRLPTDAEKGLLDKFTKK